MLERRVENVYWQAFCGMEFFQHEPPIHPSSVSGYQTRLGPLGCEALLRRTIVSGMTDSKGKAHEHYEFGVKVGVVACLKKPFIRAAHALPGRPYDSNTLIVALAGRGDALGCAGAA